MWNTFIYSLNKYLFCGSSENTKDLVPNSNFSPSTWPQIKQIPHLQLHKVSIFLVSRREDFCPILKQYQSKKSGTLVPGGVDTPASDENTREWQDTPKRKSVPGLGKVQSAPTKPYGKQWAESGQDPEFQLCPICGPYKNLSEIQSYPWLGPNCRIFSLLSQSHGAGQRKRKWGYDLQYWYCPSWLSV